MKSLAVTIPECALIPRGYAVAYWQPWSMTAVCYPVGLHLIVSVARSSYGRFVNWRCPEGWETLWRVRYERGRQRGYADGYDAGLRHAAIARQAEESHAIAMHAVQ